MYGDPKRLYALAAEVERHESDLRARAAALRAAGRTTQWSSAAGGRHRERLEDDLNDVDRCADGLAEAVAALRAHARTVEHRLQLIAAAEREVRAWFGSAQRSLANRVDAAVDAVQDFVSDVTPWDGWPWSPGNLPAPGHLDWLDAANLVKGAPWKP